MKLNKLLKNIDHSILQGKTNIEITGITDRSKDIKPGYLFICLEGRTFDGHNYIEKAIESGAVAICVSKRRMYYNPAITVICVEDTRETMSYLAQNFYGNNFSFKFVGVTGTNGKTTSTFMLKSVLNSAGYRVGVIGTSGVFFEEEELRGEDLTTRDPLEMFELLNIFEEKKADFVLAEISAHALELRKNRGIISDIAIFTNLTEDHLDFFKDMERYGKAKQSYFVREQANFGVINIDDLFSAEIIKTIDIPYTTISVYGDADYSAKKINFKKKSFVVKTPSQKYKIMLTMPGVYNIHNALGVIAAAEKLGICKVDIISGLKFMPEIAGRFNVFDFGKHGTVILDFAHTPDGLEKVLTVGRELCKKRNARLISVFGCGGNRDRAKRPIMGQISGTIADHTIISIDNPRYEDPFEVMDDIAVGLKERNASYDIVMPREDAIEKAVIMAKKNDIIIVSGKGVEPFYEVNGIKHPYNEAEVIKNLQKKYK